MTTGTFKFVDIWELRLIFCFIIMSLNYEVYKAILYDKQLYFYAFINNLYISGQSNVFYGLTVTSQEENSP